MSSFKESVIIPKEMFQKCRYHSEKNVREDFTSPRGRTSIAGHILNISEKEKNPQLIRQKEILNERLNKRIKYPILAPEITQSKIKTAPDVVGIKISDILKRIKTSQKPNISSVLDKMIRNNFLWNRNGELIVNGQIIDNSNIINLMRFLSGTEKVDNYDEMPIGIDDLWEILSEIEVPTSWIKQKPLTLEEPRTYFQPERYPFEKGESFESSEEGDEEFYEAVEKLVKKEKKTPIRRPHVRSTKLSFHTPPKKVKKASKKSEDRPRPKKRKKAEKSETEEEKIHEDPDIKERKETRFVSRKPSKWDAWTPTSRREERGSEGLRKSLRSRKAVEKLTYI